MGVLTDILIADRAQAQRVVSARVPLEAWRGIDAKGIDLTMLSMLTAVLDETDYDTACVRAFALLAAHDDADGPWAYAFPPSSVASLASLDRSTTSHRAEEWFELARDEFRRQGYRRRDVRLLLTELADLARSARNDAAELLIWLSL